MKQYISGLLLFERIINGQFIRNNENELVQNELYNLMAYHMGLLKDKKKIKLPKYIKNIWENMINLMVIHSYGREVWINRYQITNIIENNKLKNLLCNDDNIGEFFNFVDIENNCIQLVQQFD
eukprot:80577_1